MPGSFLDALTELETEELRSAGRRASYGAGVTLFHQGDDAGPVIVLLAGRAKVTSLSSAGREAIVAVRGPGDLLGELAAIDAEPRSGTVTTLEPVDALLVPGSAFAAFLEHHPRVAPARRAGRALRDDRARRGRDRAAAVPGGAGRLDRRLARGRQQGAAAAALAADRRDRPPPRHRARPRRAAPASAIALWRITQNAVTNCVERARSRT